MQGNFSPQGWYSDPNGGPEERWWDGFAWTHYLRKTGDLSPGREATDGPVPALVRVRVSNPYVWLIALTPFGYSFAFLVLFGFSLASPMAGFFANGLLPPLVAIVLFGLAVSDRDALRRTGCDAAASPFWMLLTPLCYLVARSLAVRRHGDGGGAPIVAFLVQIVVLFFLALFFLGIQPLLSNDHVEGVPAGMSFSA